MSTPAPILRLTAAAETLRALADQVEAGQPVPVTAISAAIGGFDAAGEDFCAWLAPGCRTSDEVEARLETQALETAARIGGQLADHYRLDYRAAIGALSLRPRI
jgi:hypothetical protein